LKLTVQKYVGFYIRDFYVLVPCLDSLQPKARQNTHRTTADTPPSTTIRRLAKPTMGVKNFHKEFLGRKDNDKDDEGIPKHSLDDIEVGSVVVAGQCHHVTSVHGIVSDY